MKYYSKDNQDKWVMEKVFNLKKGGFYVDVGAYNGVMFSNTKSLEDFYGWSGICIEPNTQYYKQLIKKRSDKKNIFVNECAWDKDNEEVEFICETLASGIINPETRWNETRLKALVKEHSVVKKRTKSLVTILKEAGAPKHIDFLSMDAEGSEERIMHDALFEEYKFSCILVEVYTECFPNEKNFDSTTNVHTVLKENGYKVIKKIGQCEYFYIPENK